MATNSHHIKKKVVAVIHETHFESLIGGFFSLNLSFTVCTEVETLNASQTTQ